MRIIVDNYIVDNTTTYWGQEWQPEYLQQFYEEGNGRYNVQVSGRVILDDEKEYELRFTIDGENSISDLEVEDYGGEYIEDDQFLEKVSDIIFGHSINENVVKVTKEQLQQIIKEGVEKLHKKTLIENRIKQINEELEAERKALIKELRELGEHDFDDFETRDSYVSSDGRLVGHHSDNQIAGAKLAYDELKEAGVPVRENRWHSNDPTVLFIIDAEESSAKNWVSPYYGSEIAKREGWKNQMISDFVVDTLKKYELYAEWKDNATLAIRSI